MYMEIMTAVFAGAFLGGTVMFWLQRKRREWELIKIVKLSEDILNEREIKAADPGGETLYAKAEHCLVRVQEMMQGRRDMAEKAVMR